MYQPAGSQTFQDGPEEIHCVQSQHCNNPPASTGEGPWHAAVLEPC